MDFYSLIDDVLELLRRRGRVTYRALKRQFHLDDDVLDDLKEELIKAQRVAVDENGDVLVWVGDASSTPAPTAASSQPVQIPAAEGDRAVPAEPRTPDAERRQLTVLFCDLVDSTVLASQLDPEDWREVVRAYQSTCAEVIQRYAGHIAQYLGDGLLVYFGYPLAHEDDGQRAVRAAVGMVEAMGQLNQHLAQERGVKLAIRVGIHTGLVVVGQMGGGGRQEQLALGDTPNVAARLQGLAAPDTIVISAATQRLIQGVFACQELGAPMLKGVATPVQVFRVLRERDAQSLRDVAASRGLTQLVGREQEVGLLLERWAQVKDRLGQVVLLNGEAGIGKSRLVQVVKERVAGERHTWVEVRGSPYHQQSPLYPVITHLHRLLGWRQEEAPHEKLRTLERVLNHYGLSLPDVVPLFAPLLALPLPDYYPPLVMAPHRQKQKTLEALLMWLLRETEQQPVLFIVEDLHWLDPSTLELLSLLIEQAATMRLFTLLTCRPTFRPPWAPHAHLSHLTLSRLPRPQAARMIEQVTGGKALPAEVRQQLLARTDGVPLFVEELTKMILESGFLREADDRYELTGPLPTLAIPVTLHDSLIARLDRLNTAKTVAQLGAAIGRQFSYELLRAVWPVDEATLRHALGELVETELVYQRGLPPQVTYVFKHALIQEAAYQSLLKSLRQQYHQQIAQALLEGFSETVETQPELLAHHFTEAGLPAQAVPYWLRAGQRAVERSANVEAISHLTTGLGVLKTLPDTPERTQQELTLQLALGAPLLMIKGYEALEVGQAYTRAQELCQQVGDSSQRFSALVGLWRFYLGQARFQTARELAEQCFTLAQGLRDPALMQEAHAMLGSTLLYLGELVPARAHLEEGIALYHPQQGCSPALSHSTDPGVVCLSHASWVLWMLGYPEQALTCSREACALAERLSQPYNLAYALTLASALSMFRREAWRVQEQAEATIALSREQGYARWLAVGIGWRGWALAEQGAVQEGLAQIDQAMAMGRTDSRAMGLSQVPLRLAEIYGKAGQAEEGLRVLAEALAAVSNNDERRFEAELYRLKGELLVQQARDQDTRQAAAREIATVMEAEGTGAMHASRLPVESETCFRQALAIARRQQAKSYELRAALSLSRLWQRQGKRDEAHQLLAEIYGWFTEGFDTADLRDAKALLDAWS
jgi:class 3 adenylate cyclase/tetratricopeptide (TPR) repeat protein